MVEYDIFAKRPNFGDEKMENALKALGFHIKRMRTEGENVVYETEIERRLTEQEAHKILSIGEIFEVKKV